jgi:hypothetical protein
MMKDRRLLPIPFLVLILAGLVSLGSLAMGLGTRSGGVRQDSVQMQTVEQERLAAIYFSVLSWLSDVVPRAEKPHPAPSSMRPRLANSISTRPRSCPIELCMFRHTRNLAAQNRAARRIE